MEKRGNDQISDSEMKTGCGCIDEEEATKKRVAQTTSKVSTIRKSSTRNDFVEQR